MILPIYTYGQPVLRQVAQDISADYPELPQLITNMWETLAESDGIGLAAPQVGLSIRLVVIDLDLLREDLPEYTGFRKVFINGHIVEIDEEAGYDTKEEGCLSIPDIHETVKRAKRIRVRWQDEQFVEHDEWIEGYLARVIQHEFDHLEGQLFTDRISPFRKTMVRSKIGAIQQGKFRCGYRVKPAARR